MKTSSSLAQLKGPSYARVYADIAVGYALLAASIALVFSDAYLAQAAAVKAIILPALCLFNGLVFHYLTLFTHAAGHWELAEDKKLNDRLGNILVGYIFLTTIDLYRKKHFGHHRFVGSEEDPEGAYSIAPNAANFCLVSLLLIPILKITGGWKNKNNAGKKPDIAFTLVVFAAIQCAVLYGFFANGLLIEWLAVWAIPFFSLTPLFNWIRTLCEHRPFDSPAAYAATYRAFSNDMLGFFLGAAGFRDHDLHHKYPHVHYTQFAEFQKINPLERSRDSYGATICRLFSRQRDICPSAPSS